MHFVRRFIYGGFGAILVIAAACTGEPPEQKAVAMPMTLKPDIVATNAFYYYHDVDAAWEFYRDTLGLETVIDYGFAKIMRLADASYVTLVEAAEGMHSADEPKNVTLHLVTDQLNRWHTWFLQSGVHIEYGGDGAQNTWQNNFVVRDTEGYRLRFVRYNPHPNQDSFVDAYAYAPPVSSSVNTTDDMNIRATAFSVYYDDVEKVRPFFEGLFDVESIGLLDGSPLYQLAGSGFLSLEESAASCARSLVWQAAAKRAGVDADTDRTNEDARAS